MEQEPTNCELLTIATKSEAPVSFHQIDELLIHMRLAMEQTTLLGTPRDLTAIETAIQELNGTLLGNSGANT